MHIIHWSPKNHYHTGNIESGKIVKIWKRIRLTVFDAFEQGDEVVTKIIEGQGKTLTNPLNVYVKKYYFAGKKEMIPDVD
jgi:hypothetical protein